MEALVAMGHEVTVLTGYPNYPGGKIYPGYRIRPWQREEINGVSVVRVPLYPSHDSGAVKRVLNYMSYAICASLLGPFLVRRPDVVHAYLSPLTAAFPAWLISRLYRAPLSCEVQDIWPESLAATGMLNNRRILSAIGWVAKWVYRRAASIRVISQGFRENLVSKGVDSEKIKVIPNWVDFDKYEPQEHSPELARELGLDNGFTVMFAGNMGPAQDLENVLEAAALLRDTPQIRFAMVGDGISFESLKKRAVELDLPNVKFLGRYPGEEMSRLYALADVLLVHLRDTTLFRITIPHKIYGYMASGTPVLAAVEGDVADVVRDYGAGMACAAGDPQALAETVRAFARMSPDERQKMADSGQQATRERHALTHVVEELVIAMRDISSDHDSEGV